jgi:hypothetical protein
VPTSHQVLSTILKHDAKVTSYKIALIRAINDIVLTYPDLKAHQTNVAIPLRRMADFWIAYYWPFVDPQAPILQGQVVKRATSTNQDISFRPALTELRNQWEAIIGGIKNPADGFFLINELRLLRQGDHYPQSLLKAYQQATNAIIKTLEMPIRYAGPGEWSIFPKPQPYAKIASSAVAIPGTQLQDRCTVISLDLWTNFRDLSLWVEALSIHEWCLFSERISGQNRGFVYTLLTARPDNRRPLTWERNQIDLLIMEGCSFTCPWTQKPITQGISYDLDHILPIALYPTNELWNLVPADPEFNSHQKRDRLPTPNRLSQAQPHLQNTYQHYGNSSALAQILQEDARLRFTTVSPHQPFPEALTIAVIDLVSDVAASRNLARF